MTTQELYETIKEKKESAERDLETTRPKALIEKNDAEYELLIMKLKELNGEIDAYTDVLCLIESSGLLNSKIYCDKYTLNAHRK